jgi:hypothetical protein
MAELKIANVARCMEGDVSCKRLLNGSHMFIFLISLQIVQLVPATSSSLIDLLLAL